MEREKRDKRHQILRGLYGPDGGFRSDRQIKRDMALRGDLPKLQHLTPIAKTRDIGDYLIAADKRSEQMKEITAKSENEVKISIPRTSNIHFMGDLHIGHPNTNHKRIHQELEAIANSGDDYVVLVGDIVDGMFWGGESQAEQSLSLSEQGGALKALFRKLRDKVLFAVSGEHDSKWASRSGGDPYGMLADETGAPYVRGIAEVELEVGDEDYKIVAQHRAAGHSMYNKNHPTHRQSRFHLQGADVYVSAHNHKKQVSQEAIRSFGESKQVTHIAVGPYKGGDNYGDRMGFVSQKEDELYGASIRVHDDKKKVDVKPDILDAISEWSK